MMTKSELAAYFDKTMERCREILIAKNTDYATGDDPFANFRAAKTIGIEPEMGIMLRSMDKFKRIQAFLQTGMLAVKKETVQDAVDDVINYMILLGGMLKERLDLAHDLEMRKDLDKASEFDHYRKGMDTPEPEEGKDFGVWGISNQNHTNVIEVYDEDVRDYALYALNAFLNRELPEEE